MVEFVERPGLEDFDILANLAYFLQSIGEAATVEDFDRNKIVYDENLQRVYTGNGIPDVVELWLIEYVLKDPSIDLSYQSGAASGTLWDTWSANLAQAHLDLSGLDERIIRVVAAYMTLGDYHSEQSIVDLVQTHFQIGLDPQDYDNSQASHFAANEDADNDGVANAEEWSTASPDGSLGNLASFGSSATNGSDSSSGSGNSPPQCDNAVCLNTGAMAVTIPESRFAIPEPISNPPFPHVPSYDAATGHPIGSSIFLGTETRVMAQADRSHGTAFEYWDADDTLIDGSRKSGESFVLPSDVTARAYFTRCKTVIANDSPGFFTISVSPGPGTFQTTEEIDGTIYRIVVGPPGSYVTLSAGSDRPDMEVYAWECKTKRTSEDPSFCYSESVTVYLGNAMRPLLLPLDQLPQDLRTVSVASSDGGYIKSGAGYNLGSYKGSITVRVSSLLNFGACSYSGYKFNHWVGVSGSGSNLTGIPASSVSSTVQAFFQPRTERVLTVGASDEMPCSGYVTVTPARKYYSQTDEVTLTAHPAPGYKVAFWEGLYENDNQPPTAKVISIIMAQNRFLTPVFAEKPVLLVQKLGSSQRDVEEMGKAFITDAPAMPDLYASVPNGKSSLVQWRLSLTFTPDQQDTVTLLFPTGGPLQLAGNSPWHIDFGDAFIGGEATLSYQYCGMEEAETLEFDIEGANPQRAAILQKLTVPDNPHQTLIYQALAWDESTHRQFTPMPRNISDAVTLFDLTHVGPPLPCFAADGGYGVMQITNPRPTQADIWNWRHNCDSGMQLYWTKWAEMAAIRGSIPYPDDKHEDDTIENYHGGLHWNVDWDPINEQWVWTEVLGQDYLQRIRGFMSSQPWLEGE